MLFYCSTLGSETTFLDPDESAHLVKVLRKKNGDELQLTDGKGTLARAIIKNAHPKNCEVEIREKQVVPPDPYYVHVAVAPTKNMERIAWFVEKAVEIGIHEISFPICKHNERRVLKTDKLIAKAVSAMKQSLSPFLPQINEATPFAEFIAKQTGGQRFIAHLDGESTPELSMQAQPKQKYCVVIGPEGDFDVSEIDLAQKAGFKKVKMGAKRLRTETAALHACSLLNAVNYSGMPTMH